MQPRYIRICLEVIIFIEVLIFTFTSTSTIGFFSSLGMALIIALEFFHYHR